MTFARATSSRGYPLSEYVYTENGKLYHIAVIILIYIVQNTFEKLHVNYNYTI